MNLFLLAVPIVPYVLGLALELLWPFQQAALRRKGLQGTLAERKGVKLSIEKRGVVTLPGHARSNVPCMVFAQMAGPI